MSSQEKEHEKKKPFVPPEPAPPVEARDDVRAASSPVRCPYCHTDVSPQARDWVACRECLARHHQSCWKESGACASCRSTEPLEAKPRARRGLLLGAALALASLAIFRALTLGAGLGEPSRPNKPGPVKPQPVVRDNPAANARHYKLVVQPSQMPADPAERVERLRVLALALDARLSAGHNSMLFNHAAKSNANEAFMEWTGAPNTRESNVKYAAITGNLEVRPVSSGGGNEIPRFAADYVASDPSQATAPPVSVGDEVLLASSDVISVYETTDAGHDLAIGLRVTPEARARLLARSAKDADQAVAVVLDGRLVLVAPARVSIRGDSVVIEKKTADASHANLKFLTFAFMPEFRYPFPVVVDLKELEK